MSNSKIPCSVPGCEAMIWANSTTRVCRAHRCAAGHCRCRYCRKVDGKAAAAAPAAAPTVEALPGETFVRRQGVLYDLPPRETAHLVPLSILCQPLSAQVRNPQQAISSSRADAEGVRSRAGTSQHVAATLRRGPFRKKAG